MESKYTIDQRVVWKKMDAVVRGVRTHNNKVEYDIAVSVNSDTPPAHLMYIPEEQLMVAPVKRWWKFWL